MSAERERFPDEEDAVVEGALLSLILDLHPDHLTAAELVCEMSADPDKRGEEDDVRRALDRLLRTGLTRHVDSVITPTHVALRAGALLRA